MIDINQVQRDFDNGVMLCRETIRQVIELAADLQREHDSFVGMLPSTLYMDPPDGGSVTVLEQFRRMAEDAAKFRDGVTSQLKASPCLNQMHNDGAKIVPRSCPRCKLGPCQAGVTRLPKDSSCG